MRYEIAIINLLNTLNRKLDTMALDFTAVKAAVAAEKTVVEGAVLLMNELTTELRAALVKLADALANSDPAATAAAQAELDALAAESTTQTEALAVAIAANTVAGGAVIPPLAS
jgi:hypothetical protein